ncbi:MAG TPA: ABC transporter substrate-binding protein [Solirubrobacteraceae bacterium]|jgi:peptide/nickel transport system substrate-binding protein|nr:ABC transporter substrate-binding protein [Solirubrobacteraceae bacterium]
MKLSRARTAPLCLILGALALAGCGAASTSSGGSPASGTTAAASASDQILRIPYLADMSVPDPDIFYDIEGNSVILSAYDGLVTYAPGSTTIVPDLATSWTVSPDRLTYTFHLRAGVHFHDGTVMTSQEVERSFQRRLAVNQAPAYMLKPIASMATPNPLTFVVHLKSPVNPFIDYMASSWGPKVIGPDALVTHAGSDHAQTWLSTHDDGTGPYELTTFARGRQYVLTRSPDYWGAQPYFKEVLIKITPDIGTQQLELQNGDVDAIMHSFPASELNSLPSNVHAEEFPSFLRLLLYVNTNKAPFNNPAVRASLRADVNIPQLVAEAYSGTATPSIGAYPEAILPNQPTLPYAPNAKLAAAGAKAASTKNITLAYTADESGVQRRVGELIQADLAQAGWNVTVKEVQLPQVYGYVNNLSSAPDLMLQTNTPDASHPDTWARILFDSTGGLNFLGFKDPTVDSLLNQALSAPPAKATSLYQQVGQDVVASNEIFFLGDVKNVFVLNRDLTGVEQVPAYPWTVTLADLKRTAG